MSTGGERDAGKGVSEYANSKDVTKVADKNSFPTNKDKETLIDKDELAENHISDDLHADELSPPHKEKAQICGMARGLAILIIVTAVASLAVTVALIIQIYLGHYEVERHGAIATESTVCSDIGVKIMKKGGNAVDAAVASLFCLGVTDNHHSGIGGGGFMVIHNHGLNTSAVIDFRETAPAAADSINTPGSYDDKHRGISVGVPGQVRGLEHAHKKYGKLEWRALIEPSIRLAENGFTLSAAAAASMARMVRPALLEGTNLGDIYLSDGRLATNGTLVKRPQLARTYKKIAEAGSRAFYTGELAQDIVDTVRQFAGLMTLDDLKNYAVLERVPLTSTFRTHSANFTVVTAPLPAGGPALVNILNVVSGFNWTTDDLHSPHRYYQMLETFRYAYAARSGLGDPLFDRNGTVKAVNASMTSFTEAMKSRDAINNRSATIAESEYTLHGPLPTHAGTSHVSVVDADELYVSVTSTVNFVLGSKLMTKSGIILNNQLDDFTKGSPSDTANAVEGGKRPLSSMTPTVIHDSKQKCGPRFSVGGINGTYIIPGVAETILNHLVFGLDIPAAVRHPRIINTLSPTTYYEKGLNTTVTNGLPKYGYKLHPQTRRLSLILAVCKINDTITMETDPALSGHPEKF